MARVRCCGVCRKPVRECICDDEPEAPQEDSEPEPPRRKGRRMTVAGMTRRGLLPRTPAVTVHVAGSTVTAADFLDAMQWALKRSGPGSLI